MGGHVEIAERKGRARAILLVLMAIVLVAATCLNSGPASESPVRLGAWLFMVALIAFNLTSLPMRHAPGPLAFLLNDETTQAYRRISFAVGFWTTLGAAASMIVIASIVPLGAILAAKLVITAGLCVALVSFAVQELRAER